MKLSNDEMKSYLKHVVELESSVYMQENALQRSRNELKLDLPPIEHIEQPERKQFHKPSPPTREELSKKDKTDKSVYIIALFTAIICEIIITALTVQNAPIIAIVFTLFVVLMCIVPILKITQYNKKQKELDTKYEKQMEIYDKRLKSYEESVESEKAKYDEELKAYHRKVEQAKLLHDDKCATAKNNYEKALRLVNSLEKPLRDTKEILERLYSFDYIFPKYRNLVAASTFYEYFITGRVSELEGPDGAYNLYEAELRQNLIINRLDNIISQLDKVRENQFILYQEVKKTNDTLKGISNDIHGILTTTKKIEDNTELISKATSLTAYYSEIVAQNTEAIKYLSLINS